MFQYIDTDLPFVKTPYAEFLEYAALADYYGKKGNKEAVRDYSDIIVSKFEDSEECMRILRMLLEEYDV